MLVVVAAKGVLHLAVAGRYGWQRDELYYAVAGRHLQGGYVEFPPVTAWLSALVPLQATFALFTISCSRSSWAFRVRQMM